MSSNVIFYFLPVIFIFLVSCIIFVYCKYKCLRESSEEATPPKEAVVPALVAPSGVPEWVTSPRLLCMHYYFNSMFSWWWLTIRLHPQILFSKLLGYDKFLFTLHVSSVSAIL